VLIYISFKICNALISYYRAEVIKVSIEISEVGIEPNLDLFAPGTHYLPAPTGVTRYTELPPDLLQILLGLYDFEVQEVDIV
jgi:hypothetical protein